MSEQTAADGSNAENNVQTKSSSERLTQLPADIDVLLANPSDKGKKQEFTKDENIDKDAKLSFTQEEANVSSKLDTSKDSEGFLTPPPASTLLIRRTKGSGGGGSTYVVSSSPPIAPPVTSPDTNIVDNELEGGSHTEKNAGSQFLSTPRPYTKKALVDHKRRDPNARPIKKPKFKDGTEFTLTKETASFQEDGSVTVKSQDGSEVYSFPTPHEAFTSARTFGSGPKVSLGRPSTGKPPLGAAPPFTGPGSGRGRKKGSLGKKRTNEKNTMRKPINIDPLTGKRRYTRKKRFTIDNKKIVFRRYSSPERKKTPKLSDKGIWKPTDDLRLIANVLMVNDLKLVHIGVKFSCPYTYEEIEERWRNLLYNQKISLVAQTAISNLHPIVKSKIYASALFSPAESEIVAQISEPNPDLEHFQQVLDDNINVFNRYRTAFSLRTHWSDLRDCNLLAGQSVLDVNFSDNFEHFERKMNNLVPLPNVDEVVAHELLINNKNIKKKIRFAEEELRGLQRASQLILSNPLFTFPTCTFDNQTIAILKGKQVRYMMRSQEITLGRRTSTNRVDADLGLEGSSAKVSRRQAVIQMLELNKFYMYNIGRHVIYVDGYPLFFREGLQLFDQSVVQIQHMTFLFVVNKDMIRELQLREQEKQAALAAEAANASLNQPILDPNSEGELEKIIGSPLPVRPIMSSRLASSPSPSYLIPSPNLNLQTSIDGSCPLSPSLMKIGSPTPAMYSPQLTSSTISSTLQPMLLSHFPTSSLVSHSATNLSPSPTSKTMLPSISVFNSSRNVSYMYDNRTSNTPPSNTPPPIMVASATPSDLTIRPSYGPPVTSPYITSRPSGNIMLRQLRPISSQMPFMSETGYSMSFACQSPQGSYMPVSTGPSLGPQTSHPSSYFHYVGTKELFPDGSVVKMEQQNPPANQMPSSMTIPSSCTSAPMTGPSDSQVRLDNTSLGLPDVTILAFPQSGTSDAGVRTSTFEHVPNSPSVTSNFQSSSVAPVVSVTPTKPSSASVASVTTAAP